MKKIKLFIMGTLLCLYSVAQIPLSELVEIKLPKEAEKLKDQQLESLVKSKKEYSKKLKTKSEKISTYKINTMLLQLNGASGPVPADYLENLKNNLTDLSRGIDGRLSPSFNLEIKSINNYKVLINHMESHNSASYKFFLINNSNTALLNGILDYDKSDKPNKDKANKTLDDLLKSIKFK